MLHPISTLLSALGTLAKHTLPLEAFANSKGIFNGFEFGHSEEFACNTLEYALWFDQGTHEALTKEELTFLFEQLDGIKQALEASDCQTYINSFGVTILICFE